VQEVAEVKDDALVPAGQVEQAVEEAEALYLPATHTAQVDDNEPKRAIEKLPAGQGVQAVAPEEAAKLPAAQPAQPTAPAAPA
jgi:hypothetical protein